MHTDASPVGECPRCEAPIAPGRVLIRYERGDGEAMYATCPDCTDVVRLDRPVESTV